MQELLKKEYRLCYYKTATETQLRTLLINKPLGECILHKTLNQKLIHYSFITLGAPVDAVTWTKK